VRNMKKLSLIATAAFAALVMTACGATGGSAGGNQDRLVVAQSSDAITLDLHAGNDASSSLVSGQIFETLIVQTPDMELVPGLATEWTLLEDGITWEFKLREGVTFHNGEPFTANDVKFSFERAAGFAQVAPILGDIDVSSIEVVDDHTIRVATYHPFAPFLRNLAHGAAGIMNQTAVEAAGDTVGQNPVGTGPFEFVNWINGDEIELRRFEDYWGDLPAYETLVFRAIQENANRLIELETGQIDIAIAIAPQDVARVEADDNLVLLRQPNFSTQYIGMNTNDPILSDVRVRQAINYAVDVDLILETVLSGVGGRAVGPFGSNVWGFNPNLTGYGFDEERARELLAEAGYPDGFEIELWSSNSGTGPIIVEAVQNMLGRVGIRVNVSQMEWGAYVEALNQGNHQMFIMGWGTITGDADYGLYALFHSSQDPSAGNRFFLDVPGLDELIDEARSLTDDDARREQLYWEIQEIIVEEAPWVFLITGETVVATSTRVQGLRLAPSNHHRFAPVTFSE